MIWYTIRPSTEGGLNGFQASSNFEDLVTVLQTIELLAEGSDAFEAVLKRMTIEYV